MANYKLLLLTNKNKVYKAEVKTKFRKIVKIKISDISNQNIVEYKPGRILNLKNIAGANFYDLTIGHGNPSPFCKKEDLEMVVEVYTLSALPTYGSAGEIKNYFANPNYTSPLIEELHANQEESLEDQVSRVDDREPHEII